MDSYMIAEPLMFILKRMDIPCMYFKQVRTPSCLPKERQVVGPTGRWFSGSTTPDTAGSKARARYKGCTHSAIIDEILDHATW